MNRRQIAIVLAVCTSACVPKGKYDASLADAQAAHTALAASLDREKADRDALATLRQQLDAAQAQVQAEAQKLSDLSTANQNLQAHLDQETAIDAQLRAELGRLGKNVDQMLQEKGTLSKALEDAKARLEELRKLQAAAAAQAALFQQFVQKFKKMIDAGQLKITTRNGRLVLQLPNDVLFDSGQTVIKPAGRDALVAIASVLRTIQGRSFQVGGDTDNVPIQTPIFPSNWSSRRREPLPSSSFSSRREWTPERSRRPATASTILSPATTPRMGARRIGASKSPFSQTSTSSCRRQCSSEGPLAEAVRTRE